MSVQGSNIRVVAAPRSRRRGEIRPVSSKRGGHRDTVGPHETCFVLSSWILYYVRVVGRIRKLSMSSGRTRDDLDLPALDGTWPSALGGRAVAVYVGGPYVLLMLVHPTDFVVG